MKRKLLLLDIVLLCLIGLVCWRYREIWLQAHDREQRGLGAQVPPAKAAPLPPLPSYTPVQGVQYADVALKMLFSRDRNPNIIYEPAAPPPAPPPMPALPTFYGLMTGFGDPGIILSDKPGSQRTFRAGEMVGPFKLVSFDNSRVVFDWDGQKVERRLDELVAKVTTVASTGGGISSAPAPTPQTVVSNVSPLPLGPGQDIGGGFHACQPNDSTPSGTVQGGLRKVEVATPFGKSCKWEPAK